jgi:hypothetical protein
MCKNRLMVKKGPISNVFSCRDQWARRDLNSSLYHPKVQGCQATLRAQRDEKENLFIEYESFLFSVFYGFQMGLPSDNTCFFAMELMRIAAAP